MTISTITGNIESYNVNNNITTCETGIINKDNNNDEYKVYTRRWLMLFIFASIFTINSYQWIQYTIVSNIMQKFYNVSDSMINNTSVLYLITFLPLIIPATYVIEKKGLRFVIILAALGNCIGSWLKVPSAVPDRFYLGFLGQTVLSVSQLFILSIPPKLAGVWFGPNQISTACAIGVFGSQLGPGLGFLITPMIVHDHEDINQIGHELFVMFLVIAVITTVILLLTLAFFQKEPPTPASNCQEGVIQNVNILQCYKRILLNKAFVKFMIAYGISIGLLNAISTLLNELIVPHFPVDGAEFAGRIGAIFVAIGVFSAVILGIILDKTKRYKEVTTTIYFLTCVGMLTFTFSTYFESKISVYIATVILGFFMSGYSMVGYEMATELTYPEPEFISSGVLLSISQTAGVILTVLFEYVIIEIGDFYTNICICSLLLFGSIITMITPNIQNRQDYINKNNSELKN